MSDVEQQKEQQDLNNENVSVQEQELSEAMATANNTNTDEVKANDNDLALECETLRTQIKELESNAQNDKAKLLLAIADAENARKRAEADVERERKFALEKFVKAIIPVIDSLDRALELSDRNDPATKATIDGVEGTFNLLIKELKAFGVDMLNPVGEPFDPNFHQAISMVPSDEIKPNHIVAVMQKGFVLNGRVVRAATVMVAKANN